MHCPECGSELPHGLPASLCPRCALSGLLDVPPAEISRLPRSFGDYELLEEISRGGMGIVYKARQKSLDRIVAVKLLLLGQYASEEFIHRFRMEASAAASLRHPNIVAIHEVGLHEGQHYFAMDFVDGPDLAQLVCRPLPARRAAGYVKTIAEAIHFAHTRRILHRDLKPSNVLIDSTDQPRVTDFGLAKNLATDSELTLTGQVIGSPGFMPPEQALGERGKIGLTSDIYSVGAILYHALTGRPPFVGQTVSDTLHRLVHDEVISPQRRNPSVPVDLDTICLKCLEKDPSRRYQTAQELADELGRFLRGEPIHARRISPVHRIHRWALRNRALSGFMVALGVAMLLAGWSAYDWWRRLESQRAFAIGFVVKREDLMKGLVSNIALSSADLAAATGQRVAQNPNAQRLKVAIYTDTDQLLTAQQLAPFLRKVERGMSRHYSRSVQIDLYLYLERDLVEKNLLNGLIDIARIGEGPLVRLRRTDAAITPLVQQISGGKTHVIYVAINSPVTNLAGLRGRKLAAGNQTSTSSGHNLIKELLQAGLHAKDLELKYQGQAEDNPNLVAAGNFDAAVGRKERLAGSLTNRFRILHEFRTPTLPWAGRAKLDPTLGRAFADAFAGMKDPVILGNFPDDASQGFKPADTNYFLKLDQEMRTVEMEFFGPGGNPAQPQTP
jgi:ABC-type phosphate/phosphonate transport system substrate-binding protein